MEHKLVVSASPHVHSGDTIQKHVRVLVALIPAFLVALYVFRLDAIIITGCSVLLHSFRVPDREIHHEENPPRWMDRPS